MWDALNVAAVQYNVVGGLSLLQFKEKIEKYVQSASHEGAQLVVFPELCIVDLLDAEAKTLSDERALLWRIAKNEGPELRSWGAELCKRIGVSVLFGTLPRLTDGGRIAATAILQCPDGGEFLQDKVFLSKLERNVWEWVPSKKIEVWDAPWGPTVILIGEDVEIPEVSVELRKYNPEVFLAPFRCAEVHSFHRVRWAAQARAVEHFAYVVQTGVLGNGLKTPNLSAHYGQAAVITPCAIGFEGLLSQGVVNEPGVVFGTLNLECLRKARRSLDPNRKQACDEVLICGT